MASVYIGVRGKESCLGELSVNCPEENAAELTVGYFDAFKWKDGRDGNLVQTMLECIYDQARLRGAKEP